MRSCILKSPSVWTSVNRSYLYLWVRKSWLKRGKAWDEGKCVKVYWRLVVLLHLQEREEDPEFPERVCNHHHMLALAKSCAGQTTSMVTVVALCSQRQKDCACHRGARHRVRDFLNTHLASTGMPLQPCTTEQTSGLWVTHVTVSACVRAVGGNNQMYPVNTHLFITTLT